MAAISSLPPELVLKVLTLLASRAETVPSFVSATLSSPLFSRVYFAYRHGVLRLALETYLGKFAKLAAVLSTLEVDAFGHSLEELCKMLETAFAALPSDVKDLETLKALARMHKLMLETVALSLRHQFAEMGEPVLGLRELVTAVTAALEGNSEARSNAADGQTAGRILYNMFTKVVWNYYLLIRNAVSRCPSRHGSDSNSTEATVGSASSSPLIKTIFEAHRTCLNLLPSSSRLPCSSDISIYAHCKHIWMQDHVRRELLGTEDIHVRMEAETVRKWCRTMATVELKRFFLLSKDEQGHVLDEWLRREGWALNSPPMADNPGAET